jgi:hypothetical protein
LNTKENPRQATAGGFSLSHAESAISRVLIVREAMQERAQALETKA